MKPILYLVTLLLTFNSFPMDDEKVVAVTGISDTFIDFYHKYVGEEVSLITDNSSQWQILYLISKDKKDDLEKLLKNEFYKLESINQNILGMELTMLHAAAYYNSINIIGWLVKNKANLTPKDQYSRTPHDIAILFNSTNAAILIEKAQRLEAMKKTEYAKPNCVIL